METENPCCCCLLRPPDKDLYSPYVFLGVTETFADLLEDCFQIHFTAGLDNECGICEECASRLRDAHDFKLQVQCSQVQLQMQLVTKRGVVDENVSDESEVDEDDKQAIQEDLTLHENHFESEMYEDDKLKIEEDIMHQNSQIAQPCVPATNDVRATRDSESNFFTDSQGSKLQETSTVIEEEKITRSPIFTPPPMTSNTSPTHRSNMIGQEHLQNPSLSPGLDRTSKNSDIESSGSASECYDSDRDQCFNPEFEEPSSDEEETAEDVESAEIHTFKESQASTSSNVYSKQKCKVKKSYSSDEEAINNSNAEEQQDVSTDRQMQIPSTADVDEDRQKPARIRTKDFCLFCETGVLNFARHVIRNHALEAEVQKILSYPKKSRTRKNLLTDLRKKGNYIANVSKCVKPMKKSELHNDYLPCENCLGFYSRKQLWKHRKSCQPMSETSHSQVEAQNFMLRNLKVDKKLKEEVFCKMRPDRVSLEAKKDSLICAFGAQYLRIHREKHSINVTSRKMRELAKLLIELKKLKPGLKDLMDSLKPQNYDIIITAIKKVAGYDEKLDRYSAPTYPMNIRTSLKQCCDIAIMNILKSGSAVQTASMQADVKTLIRLIDMLPIGLNTNIETPDKELNPPLSEVNANITCSPLVVSAKRKRNLVPWTSEQKKIVTFFFSKHIKTKRPPKRHECDELRGLHPDVLHNKDWLKIKVFVQNTYTKKS